MTKGTQDTATTMTLQLKPDQFQAIAAQHGWTSNTAIAKAIGIPRQSVTRILSGQQPPTAEFIAGLLTAEPLAGFRRAFNIVPATDITKEPSP